MTSPPLLQYFDQISEAPDAVPQLRRFVLDMAVRGRLVEQNRADEPASELLRRIEAEKERLKNGRRLRSGKPTPSFEEDTRPFSVPRSWEWVPIRSITADRGQKIPDKEFSYIDVSSIDKEGGRITEPHVLRPDAAPSRARKIVKRGDVIYSCVRPYLLNIAVVEEDFDPEAIASTAFAVLNGFGLVSPRYMWITLRSPFFVDCVEERMRGQAYPAINDRDFSPLPFPLPPLAEQHRIVAKVDALMALCDELEAAQAKRERRRDRLVAATLFRLGNGDGSKELGDRASFAGSARFYFNYLPRLAARREHIYQLRQTILNLAVRGRLIPQILDDDPASILLVDIVKGRDRITEALGIRRQTMLPDVPHADPPFPLPHSWIWTHVDSCFVVTGGIQKTPNRTPRNNAFPYVGVANVHRGRLDLTEVKQFELHEGELQKLRLEEDDLLIVEGNGSASEVGRCARWTGELVNCVHQNHIIRCRPGNSAISRFAEIYLNSQVGVEVMQRLAVTSAGLYNLSVGKIRNIQLPLPPLAEQHRIVAKVDELMRLCDELEARITTTATTRRQLLEAAIHEALEGESGVEDSVV